MFVSIIFVRKLWQKCDISILFFGTLIEMFDISYNFEIFLRKKNIIFIIISLNWQKKYIKKLRKWYFSAKDSNIRNRRPFLSKKHSPKVSFMSAWLLVYTISTNFHWNLRLNRTKKWQALSCKKATLDDNDIGLCCMERR